MGSKKLRVAVAGAVVATSAVLMPGTASAKEFRPCYPPPQPMGNGYCKANLRATDNILYAAIRFGLKHDYWG